MIVPSHIEPSRLIALLTSGMNTTQVDPEHIFSLVSFFPFDFT